MWLAFENNEQSYELPTLKLAPLGLHKPTPRNKAQRLKPEERRDELAGQYYYAVCGQHNAVAARSFLGNGVAKKYNFERSAARMVYFSDNDFEGYFLVSSQDNKKDLKAPIRQLKLSMKDIQWQWKHNGFLRDVMENPSGKQEQVQKWREFCTVALHETPYNNLWILADPSQKRDDAIKKQKAALRSYFPPAMAGENVWKLTVEFFERWETGRLLGQDDTKWIVRKKKVKNVKSGVAYIANEKLGRKEVVYNVRVDPATRKGKKEKEEGDWFVQVPEPDTHCWKAMKSLTDNEKCRVLKKVLACEVVWVQAGSPTLPKLGKLSVQDMVHLVKCDCVFVRLCNYYQFKHERRTDADWIQRYPFLKTRSAIFKQFESRGLDAELWDGSRKYVTDSSLFKECPPYMGCDDDHSIEAMEKLAGYRKLTVDWRNKVLFVLTGSRLKSRKIALAEGIDKCWLELTEDYYELDTSPSKGVVDWKISPSSGAHGTSGSWALDSGGGKGDNAGGGTGVPPSGEGGSHDDTAPTEGSGGVAKEAFGRQQSTDPGPEDSTQSADVPTSSAGSVREMMATLVLSGSSGGRFKSAGIRTTMVEVPTQWSAAKSWSGVGLPCHDPTIDSGAGGRPRLMVLAGGAACVEPEERSSEFDKGSGEVAGLHAREGGGLMEEGKEGEEGEEGEERDEGGEEEEKEEGEEGEEEEEEGEKGLKEGGGKMGRRYWRRRTDRVGSSRTRRSSKYPEHMLQTVPGLTTKHKDMLKALGVHVEIGKKEHAIAIEECLSLLPPEKGTYQRFVTRGQAMYEKYLATRCAILRTSFLTAPHVLYSV
ncbi:hypothetical protein CBR_g34917 [Chara braunii]|uniref:Uncharacterized protein n=1 Tax=Chara braunii TaxID=69332 RepID=A0A388LJW4_CHABU|nr:hypothetical protein CBR_g34917 [Chara braunii]|eukprot:GBG82541.1 hypothetical protein CBR_g34917 [Chara braunii]